MSETIEKNDEIVMKLLHYFITEQGYNPIVLHGAKNEIWLENLEQSYQVVRIVTNYIHNNEQLNFDLFRTKQIMKKIKHRTLSMRMETLNIFLNLGDSVEIQSFEHISHIDSVKIKEIVDLQKYNNIMEIYPTIAKNTNFKEEGNELFMKLTYDITKKNDEVSIQAEDVFKKRLPYVTYGIIAINIIVFFAMYIFGKGSTNIGTLLNFGANNAYLVQAGDYYRLITSAFLHIGVFHLAVNMYSLYIVGTQLENFLGKWKYLCVYLFSAVAGNLLSCILANGSNVVSAGASGAIFGLLGSLLYFGYHYRIYLGNVLKSQIIPILVINLLIGFIIPGIDSLAHIGGLVGGILITMALGVKYKSELTDRINGWIITLIFTVFLIYLCFFR